MTVKDNGNNSRTDTATYIVNAEPNITIPTEEFQGILVIITIFTAIVLISIVLFKIGTHLFGSKSPKKRKK